MSQQYLEASFLNTVIFPMERIKRTRTFIDADEDMATTDISPTKIQTEG